MSDKMFMQEAIDTARENVAGGRQPFGAVLVKDCKVIARAVRTYLVIIDLHCYDGFDRAGRARAARKLKCGGAAQSLKTVFLFAEARAAGTA